MLLGFLQRLVDIDSSQVAAHGEHMRALNHPAAVEVLLGCELEHTLGTDVYLDVFEAPELGRHVFAHRDEIAAVGRRRNVRDSALVLV